MKRMFFIIGLFIAVMPLKAQTQLEVAVDFSVKDIHGVTFSLFEILDQNKLVVIDFYQTDCNYCHLYAPDFQTAYEAFGCNTSNVHFFTIDQWHNNDDVNAFQLVNGQTMQAVSGTEGNGDAVHELYGILSTPTVIVIQPDRTIIEQHIWLPEADSVIAKVEAAGGIQAPCTTPVQDLTTDQIVAFPNPASSFVTFKNVPADAEIVIYDYSGREVLRTDKRTIGVENLAMGTYFVSYIVNHMEKPATTLIIK